jgi:hypothetical protein
MHDISSLLQGGVEKRRVAFAAWRFLLLSARCGKICPYFFSGST